MKKYLAFSLALASLAVFGGSASAQQGLWYTNCVSGRVCFRLSGTSHVVSTSTSESHWSNDAVKILNMDQFRQRMNTYRFTQYRSPNWVEQEGCWEPEGTNAPWRVIFPDIGSHRVLIPCGT